MAIQKQEVVGLGPSGLNDNSATSFIFSSFGPIGAWDVSTAYAQNQCVEYNGNVYRSNVATNTGNQPDITPISWTQIYRGVKDGDICIVNLTNAADYRQRNNGIWVSLANVPNSITLVDGQLVSAVAFQYLGSSFPFAKVEYTLRRSAGTGIQRKGVFELLNDGTSSVQYSHQFEELGPDVGCDITIGMSGGNVQLSYTSSNQGLPLTLLYTIRGW